jgi:hypothetical protein
MLVRTVLSVLPYYRAAVQATLCWALALAFKPLLRAKTAACTAGSTW